MVVKTITQPNPPSANDCGVGEAGRYEGDARDARDAQLLHPSRFSTSAL